MPYFEEKMILLTIGPRLLLGEVVDVTVGALAIKASLGAYPTPNNDGTTCGPLWAGIA